MIYSMTGYGKGVAISESDSVTVELKSLNSKSMDISARVSPLFREYEITVRKILEQAFLRGKVELIITLGNSAGGSNTPTLNLDNALAAYRDLMQLYNRIEGNDSQKPDWMSILTHIPGVLSSDNSITATPEQWLLAQQALRQAIDALNAFREQEGRGLMSLFKQKLDKIQALLLQIEPLEQARVENVRARLTERLEKLTGVDYDRSRLEQELIFYIEKLDINEERQRLAAHLNLFYKTMNEEEVGHGKKLGFIAQEIGREINTLGSKSNQAEMQKIVVEMKDELEQIKEQVLNVL